MMRICDAGKHASADLSPAICSLPALALVRVKSLYEGHFIMFPSIILQIKDMEQAIVWRTKALMILLSLAIKKGMPSFLRSEHISLRRNGVRDLIKSASLSCCNANREQFYRCRCSASDLLSLLLFWTTVYLHLGDWPDGRSIE